MAILADPSTAALATLVAFFVALGLLVLFIETITRARLVAVLVLDFAIAGTLVAANEAGLALVALGVAAALLANEAFERLTTR
ncbi:MAG: hypothetical protein ACT4OI_11425 [Methanobacteriota archaeon]